MAVPIVATSSSGTKIYPDRAVAAASTKPSAMASTSQQSPSRPPSAAPTTKADIDRTKTPLVESEDILAIRGNDPGSSLSPESLRAPVHANVNIPQEPINAMNPAMRGAPGAPVGPGFMPQQFFNPGMNMNVASQQGYGPTPQMQFYTPAYNPNAYAQPTNPARPGSAIQKFQNMDPKYSVAPNPLTHSNPPPQIQNNMTRRPSNYFVAPALSPVQTSYGPRAWIPNTATMITGPISIQNGNAPLQNPAMYQPAMIPPNANPALLTPPGGVQPGYSPAYAPPTVPNPNFGYPTPPETSGVLPPDIPPPIPSVYPDPAYSNISNCIYNPKGTTNVYIRGLRPETSDDDLLHMVRHYGKIVSAKAIIDTQTKMCKGYLLGFISCLTLYRFGFAKFDSIEEGVNCIVALSQAGYQCSFAKVRLFTLSSDVVGVFQ
jgi:RNA recognition motif. (a.k.a. RRM, RBD, or RNP domain)